MTAKEILVERDYAIRFSDDAQLPEFDRILQQEGMHLYQSDKGGYGKVSNWPIRGIPDTGNDNYTLVCGIGYKKKDEILPFEEFLAMISEDGSDFDCESDSGLEVII